MPGCVEDVAGNAGAVVTPPAALAPSSLCVKQTFLWGTGIHQMVSRGSGGNDGWENTTGTLSFRGEWGWSERGGFVVTDPHLHRSEIPVPCVRW